MAKSPDGIPNKFLPVDAPSNYEDKAVPVEVKLVVWVKRAGYEEEYGIIPTMPGYDFEDNVQQWVRDEMQEYGVEGGNWSNVERVTE